jgi:hypothetical protein
MTESNENESSGTLGRNSNNNDNGDGQQSESPDGLNRRNKECKNEGKQQNNNIGSNDRNWQGAKKDIGVVLGLRTERLAYKQTFEVFKDKLATYVLSDFSNPKDVLPVIKKMTDPMSTFKMNHAPSELSEEDSKKSIEQAMQTHQIKLYITQEMSLKDNMDKLYGTIIGQC